MLLAAVLTLMPSVPMTLPANVGQATHAWFLERVRAANPAMADALHAPNAERPFTVSNIWGPRRSADAPLSLLPDRPCFLRITSFWPDLSALVKDRILAALPETMTILGNDLRIGACTTDQHAQPWAGCISYRHLIEKQTLRAAQRSGLTLHFASPTVFRSSGENVPLPLPRLVFEGLARRWNASAPITIPDEVSRFADEAVMITRYRLWTERVTFGSGGAEGIYPGFVGTCSYGFRVSDHYWQSIIHLLAAFAFYAGVGARTSMGLGQTRPLESMARQTGRSEHAGGRPGLE